MKFSQKIPPPVSPHPSLFRLFFIVPYIFVAEFLIMLGFGVFKSGSMQTGEAFADALILSALLLPLLFLLIYRPLLRGQRAMVRLNHYLQQSETRFRHLAAGTGALITEVDARGKLLYVNEQSRRIWGLEPEAVMGRSAFELIHPADRERTRTAFVGWLKGQAGTHTFENRQLHADGSARHLLWSIHINRDASGEVVNLSSIAQDITSQKLANDALRVLALDFQMLSGQPLFEAVCRHLAVTLEVDTVLVAQYEHKTDRVEVVGGYDSDGQIHLFGHQLNAVLCPKMREKQFCVYPEDECCRFPDGHLLNELGIGGFLAAPLQNREGRTTGFLIAIDSKPLARRQETSQILRTFTSRLAVELEQIHISDQLNLSRTLYRDLFTSIQDPIIIADQQRIIVDVNQPATRRVFGYESDELLGRSTHVLYADAASFSKAGELVFDRQRAAGQIITGISYRRKDGSIFPAETNALKLLSEQDVPIGNFAVVRDVSEKQLIEEEKRRLELQLQQSQKMEAIGQLAGGIAHDFNNILQIIISCSEVMAAQLQPDDPLSTMNRHVLDASGKASALTRSLLTFSRKQDLQLKPVELNGLIESFNEFLHRVIGSSISLQFEPCAGYLQVSADPGHLEQVFLNLAANARDAMPEGGTLRIETSRFTLSDAGCRALGIEVRDEYARVRICDTGQGIPPELVERIFEPFFTTKDADRGTGLGLSMSFGIVKQHNGYMHVSSHLGEGTCFTIELPLANEHSMVGSEAASPGQFVKGSEHILLAEDRDDVARVMVASLETQGYRLTIAGNGQEALDLFRSAPDAYDLLLLDVSMPHLSGPQVWKEIRRERPTVKTIFLCGGPDESLTPLRQETGVVILHKPIDSVTLLEQVRSIIDSESPPG